MGKALNATAPTTTTIATSNGGAALRHVIAQFVNP